jgi:hypothetical protein
MVVHPAGVVAGTDAGLPGFPSWCGRASRAFLAGEVVGRIVCRRLRACDFDASARTVAAPGGRGRAGARPFTPPAWSAASCVAPPGEPASGGWRPSRAGRPRPYSGMGRGPRLVAGCRADCRPYPGTLPCRPGHRVLAECIAERKARWLAAPRHRKPRAARVGVAASRERRYGVVFLRVLLAADLLVRLGSDRQCRGGRVVPPPSRRHGGAALLIGWLGYAGRVA